MTGSSAAAKKLDYTPLGRLPQEQRDNLIRGALRMLAEDATLVDVASHYSISKSTLIVALMHYAESDWKHLQIARAQVAVQRASEKRMAIAAELEAFSALEKAGGETTETNLTYPRIREQLRVAEQDEKSAMWHLERLHRRVYGNSMEITTDPASYFDSPEYRKQNDEFYEYAYASLGMKRPSEAERQKEYEADVKRAGITDDDDFITSAVKLLKAIPKNRSIQGEVVDVEMAPASTPAPQPQAQIQAEPPATTNVPTVGTKPARRNPF